jgi:hypothetical protein
MPDTPQAQDPKPADPESSPVPDTAQAQDAKPGDPESSPVPDTPQAQDAKPADPDSNPAVWDVQDFDGALSKLTPAVDELARLLPDVARAILKRGGRTHRLALTVWGLQALSRAFPKRFPQDVIRAGNIDVLEAAIDLAVKHGLLVEAGGQYHPAKVAEAPRAPAAAQETPGAGVDFPRPTRAMSLKEIAAAVEMEPKTLGRLIREGKVRCRHLSRKLHIICLEDLGYSHREEAAQEALAQLAESAECERKGD